MQSRCRLALTLLSLVSASFGKVVQISVTGGGYGPSSISANVGDEIEISFTVGSATFTQSTFDQPCVPLQNGIDSGPISIPSGQGPKQFSFTLASTGPLYFFNFIDRTTAKCKSGFVATIGATPQQNSQFKTNAESFEPASQTKPTPISIPSLSQKQVAPDTPSTVTVSQEDANGGNSLPAPNSVQAIPSHSTNSPAQSSTSSPSPATPLPDTAPFSSSASAPKQGQTQATRPSDTPVSTSPSTTTASEPPTLTSQPAHAGTTNRSKIVVAVIGALLGIVTLLAAVISVLAIMRRRRRVALLPQTHYDASADNPVGNQGYHSQPSRSRTIFASTWVRLAAILLGPRWGWKRLEEKDEKRISPFLPDINPAHVEHVERVPKRLSTSTVERRPVSEMTLVQSSIGHQSDVTDASLFVNVPSSLKGSSVPDTQEVGVYIDTYPTVLSADTRGAQVGQSKPISSR